MTKTFPEFLEEVAKERKHTPFWTSPDYKDMLECSEEAAKRYSKQNQEATRAACLENVEASIEYDYQYPYVVIDKQSILNTEIVTP